MNNLKTTVKRQSDMEPIFLEQWLHGIIRQKVRDDAEYRQFLNKENMGQIGRDDVDNYQLFKLRKTLSYVYENSTFYRESLIKSGIDISEIKSLDEMATLPFTRPSDIAQHPYEFVCVSLGDVARITTFTSSGTIGPQKRIFFTDNDLETMTDFMGAGIKCVTSDGDVVQILLPSARPNDQADLLAKGVRKMGGIPIISGITPTSEEQLRIIEDSRSSVLFTSIYYINRITQETRYSHDLKTMGVKTLFVTSEYVAESIRNQLSEIWDCDVCVHYGLTEMGLGVAVECGVHNGYHFNEADLILEIVDPETGSVVKDGEEGELVFTTLNREAMPLIRYRTGDVGKIINKPCECGAHTLKKIGKVNRRLEATVKIGNDDIIYPSMFDELIYSFPDIIDYQLTLGKKENKDIFIFKVEVVREDENVRRSIADEIVSHPLIRRNIENNILAAPVVELIGQGTLTQMNRAKKLIIDER
jgi:phenylacetate-CoA ligase